MALQQQVAVANDRSQKVVEVVRDAAGQLTDGLHLLGLRELRFEVLLLRRVHDVDNEIRFERDHVARFPGVHLHDLHGWTVKPDFKGDKGRFAGPQVVKLSLQFAAITLDDEFGQWRHPFYVGG